ncbi:pyroglutamylated RF-amide peptide receptor [Delphinus delphis]|uniref:pyroglutamylated RF-amide peptide receptor n=1 Tax=Delphinus delphis TaxID=9728 RepID=UPI0028C405D0|nr:pyroglutamylated RF-amide peptide receptor [Delphinus delphis]
MQSLNITPEQFSRLLRDHNPTRAQFIALYGLRPLVYTPQLPGRAKLAFVLTGVLIFVLALFGNALVVYVVTLSEAMRTVTNIFTCSLALSDLPISFCIPVTMLENIFNNWLGDEKDSQTQSAPLKKQDLVFPGAGSTVNKSESASAGCFQLRISHEDLVQMSARAVSIRRLDWGWRIHL